MSSFSTEPQPSARAPDRPLLTVGIPVFNGEQFLEETLDSLRAQTFTDYELLISDNASTDRTGEICQDYSSRDARIQYSRNAENIGLTRNCNLLPGRATGKYFKWAMADDPYAPTFLSVCLAPLEKDSDIVLSCTQAEFIDDHGASLEIKARSFDLEADSAFERVRAIFAYRSWVNSILGVMRLSALLDTRLLPAYPGGDYALLARLALRGKIVESAAPLLRRRLHVAASSFVAHDTQAVAEIITGQVGQRSYPEWARLRDDLGSALDSQFTLDEKWTLLRVLANRVRNQRNRFSTEIRSFMRLTESLDPTRDPLR